MRNLQDFLKSHDVQLTLVNSAGETYNAGSAVSITNYSHKNLLKFYTDGNYTNIRPFTYAVLHSQREIFDGLFIKPILPTTETIIEVSY